MSWRVHLHGSIWEDCGAEPFFTILGVNESSLGKGRAKVSEDEEKACFSIDPRFPDPIQCSWTWILLLSSSIIHDVIPQPSTPTSKKKLRPPGTRPSLVVLCFGLQGCLLIWMSSRASSLCSPNQKTFLHMYNSLTDAPDPWPQSTSGSFRM